MYNNSNSLKDFDYFYKIISAVNTADNQNIYIDENFKIKKENTPIFADSSHIIEKACNILSQLHDSEKLNLGILNIKKFQSQILTYCTKRDFPTLTPKNLEKRKELAATIATIESLYETEKLKKKQAYEDRILELCKKAHYIGLKRDEYTAIALELSEFFDERSFLIKYFTLFFKDFIRIKTYWNILDTKEKSSSKYDPLSKTNTIHDASEFALEKMLTDDNSFKKALYFFKKHKELLTPQEMLNFKMAAMCKLYEGFDKSTYVLALGLSAKAPAATEKPKYSYIRSLALSVLDLLDNEKQTIELDSSHIEKAVQECQPCEELTSINEESSSYSVTYYTKEGCQKILHKLEKVLEYILNDLQHNSLNEELYNNAVEAFLKASQSASTETSTQTQKFKNNRFLLDVYKGIKKNRETFEKTIASLQKTLLEREFTDSDLNTVLYIKFGEAKKTYTLSNEALYQSGIVQGLIDRQTFTTLESEAYHNSYFEKYVKLSQKPAKLEKSFSPVFLSPKKLGEFDSSSRDFHALYDEIENSGFLYDLLEDDKIMQDFFDAVLFTKKGTEKVPATTDTESSSGKKPEESFALTNASSDIDSHAYSHKTQQKDSLPSSSTLVDKTSPIQSPTKKIKNRKKLREQKVCTLQEKSSQDTEQERIVGTLPEHHFTKAAMSESKKSVSSTEPEYNTPTTLSDSLIDKMQSLSVTRKIDHHYHHTLKENKVTQDQTTTVTQEKKLSISPTQKTQKKSSSSNSEHGFTQYVSKKLTEISNAIEKQEHSPITLHKLRERGAFNTTIDISYHVQDWFEKEPKAFREKKKYYKDERDKIVGKMRHTYPFAVTQLVKNLAAPTQRYSTVRQVWDELYQYPGSIVDYSQDSEVTYEGVFEEAFDTSTQKLSHHFFRPESLNTTMSYFRSHNSYGNPTQDEVDSEHPKSDSAANYVNIKTPTEHGIKMYETFFTYVIDDTAKKLKYIIPRNF